MQTHPFFSNRKISFSLASLSCILWGSSYPAIKNGYAVFSILRSDIPSQMLFAGYRMALAGFVLFVLAFLINRRVFSLSKRNLFDIASLGFLQTSLHYTIFYIGVANATGVKSSVLNTSTTFFSVLMAHFLFQNDRLSIKKTLGCFIGFLGVIAVNFHQSLFDFQFSLLGEACIVMAAFLFSATTIYGRSISQRMDAMVLTAYQLGFGGLVLCLLGKILGGHIADFTLSSAFLLGYLVFISSVSFALWTVLLKYNRVGMISVFNFLTPVAGVLLSGMFLGEAIFEVKNMFALLFVSTGIYFVTREF